MLKEESHLQGTTDPQQRNIYIYITYIETCKDLYCQEQYKKVILG